MTADSDAPTPITGGDDAPGDVGAQARTAERAGLGRATAIMAAGTAVSRVLGLVRTVLLGGAIGVTGSVAAESFAVANKLPNVMFAVLAAGVLNSALVPQIVKAFHQGRERTVHRILTLGAVAMTVTTVGLTLAAGFWVRVYSDGWGADQTALATAFALWCIPQLLFYGLYTLFGQVLNAREQFGWFMWSPAAANVVAIAGLGAYWFLFGPAVLNGSASVETVVSEWTPLKIFLIAGGATLGIVAQALLLLWPMHRGGYRWRWVWRGPKGELTSAARVMTWTLGAVLLEQVAVWLVTRVNSAADAGGSSLHIAGVAAYDYALVIALVPHSLVSISLMTALFTRMSRHAAAGDRAGVRDVMSEGVRLVGAFTMFAAAALAVTAPHVARLLTASSVSGESVDAVAGVLRIMAFGLVPLGMAVMVKQAYFALENARTVFLIHIPMALAWIGIAFATKATMAPQWWAQGVAAGFVATNVVSAALRLWGLRGPLAGADARRIGATYARALVAAVVAGGLGIVLMYVGPHSWGDSGWDAVATSGLMTVVTWAVMLAAYVGMARVMRLDEATTVVRALVRRARRLR